MPGPSRFTPKEDRMAAHIKASEKKKRPELSKEALGHIVYGHLQNIRKGAKKK